MNISDYLTLIKDQAFELATAEAERRGLDQQNNDQPFKAQPWNYCPDPAKIPERKRDGERVWAELASKVLDFNSWQTVADYLDENVKGVSGTSWLAYVFDRLELRDGHVVGK